MFFSLVLIGKNAYKLLYFGQFKEGLALAKLAISLNPKDVNLWALLAEAQINNKLFDDALLSIEKRASSYNSFLICASAKRAQRFTSSGFSEIANLANANPSFNCPKYKS